MTIIDMRSKTDNKLLYDLLEKLSSTNRVFTVGFYKKNGEYRVINAIHKNLQVLKGTGTPAQSAAAKLQYHNLYTCYEVQLTNEEKKLINQHGYAPKQVGKYKSIAIDNIVELRAFGETYRCLHNNWNLKPGVPTP